MEKVEILTIAILARLPIVFEYAKSGLSIYERTGNPYAVFYTQPEDISSIKVHILQTDGAFKDTMEKPLPDFKMFNLADMSKIRILTDTLQFSPNENYNSQWDGYKDAIIKI